MNIHPRHVILPSILAACAALFFISFSVNASFNRSHDVPDRTTASQPAKSLPELELSRKFPPEIQQWGDLIVQNAATNYLDPNLIAAVILQESGGQPSVVSSSGAVGLMQVMPRDGTAAGFMCINGPCFQNRPAASELIDPAFNIQYGSRMLSSLVAREGNVRESLRAYGPGDAGYYYADIVLAILSRYE